MFFGVRVSGLGVFLSLELRQYGGGTGFVRFFSVEFAFEIAFKV